MKNNKAISKVIPLIIYPFDIMVSINQTDKQFEQSFEKCGGEPFEDKLNILDTEVTEVGRCIMLKNGQTILRVNFYPENAKQYGILQHEIFHCVEFIMLEIGMKLSLDSNEAYAYLIGYVTQEIYKLLKFK